jgi:hypothetical protein
MPITNRIRSPDTACARCGAAIECDPGPHCWCARLTHRPMPEAIVGCLCPDCLGSADHDEGLPRR